jgi:hypothetical protein
VGILDALSDDDPFLAEQVRRLDDQFSGRAEIRLPYELLSEAGLAESAAFDVLGESTPPAGIYGVGATVSGHFPSEPQPTWIMIDPSGRHRPQLAIFVIPQLLGRSASDKDVASTPIQNTRLGPLVSKFTGDVPGELRVVSLPIPYEQNATAMAGSDLVCNGVTGTCGVGVRTSIGHASILTAGHVGRPLGSSVFASNSKIGSVVFTDSLSQHSPTDTVADVAVVELEHNVVATNSRRVPGQAQAKQLDNVVADHLQGPQQAWIRNVVTSFALTQNMGLWGEAFLTDRAISYSGHSGAPVYLNDGSHRIVGHIVAGAPPAYTLIQDISYILQYANVTLA